MPDSRFHHLIQRELSTRLGPHTRVAAEVDGVAGFWVSFRLDDHDEDEYWLILPRERAMRSVAGHWLLWGLLALALALAVAWLIASRISRPLKAMAESAKAVGRGLSPNPAPRKCACWPGPSMPWPAISNDTRRIARKSWPASRTTCAPRSPACVSKPK
jgi:two-component system osmolarity sensor histidine kinase EnvZ